MTDRQALLVVAHGSHLDPGSAEPAFDHAAAVRDRDLFDEVGVAYWKEEPSLRNALHTVAGDRVYVVPLFISEGYFTNRVVPRELGLDADRDRTVRYADPVGTHDAMTDVLVRRAETVTGDDAVGPGVGVAVVGHGTERSETSARSTRRHADRLRATGRFDQVEPLFLDEPPYVDDLTDTFETDDVVVVPLFVADGYHTREDVPEAIGLSTDSGGFDVPATVDGRRVWYAGAVGTEPLVADVIVERAVEAGANPDHDPGAFPLGGPDSARRAFLEWVDDAAADAARPGAADPDAPFHHCPTRTWGELAVAVRGDAGYELRHRADADAPAADLDARDGPDAAWRLARRDDRGRYRPLRGAPTLRTGWRLPGLDARELVRAVTHVYPASVEHWRRSRTGDLDATSFRETAARQTGIYADVGEVDATDLACAVEACCERCVKRRDWDAGDEPVDAPRGDGAVPCREPCSVLVAAVCELRGVEPGDAGARPVTDSDEPSGDPGVREAAFDEPGNPYRRRFRRAKRARRGAPGEVNR